MAAVAVAVPVSVLLSVSVLGVSAVGSAVVSGGGGMVADRWCWWRRQC